VVSQATFGVFFDFLLGAVVGLRCTALMGLQLRGEPDQRLGLGDIPADDLFKLGGHHGSWLAYLAWHTLKASVSQLSARMHKRYIVDSLATY
jgi:hypothetical protein